MQIARLFGRAAQLDQLEFTLGGIGGGIEKCRDRRGGAAQFGRRERLGQRLAQPVGHRPRAQPRQPRQGQEAAVGQQRHVFQHAPREERESSVDRREQRQRAQPQIAFAIQPAFEHVDDLRDLARVRAVARQHQVAMRVEVGGKVGLAGTGARFEGRVITIDRPADLFGKVAHARRTCRVGHHAEGLEARLETVPMLRIARVHLVKLQRPLRFEQPVGCRRSVGHRIEAFEHDHRVARAVAGEHRFERLRKEIVAFAATVVGAQPQRVGGAVEFVVLAGDPGAVQAVAPGDGHLGEMVVSALALADEHEIRAQPPSCVAHDRPGPTRQRGPDAGTHVDPLRGNRAVAAQAAHRSGKVCVVEQGSVRGARDDPHQFATIGQFVAAQLPPPPSIEPVLDLRPGCDHAPDRRQEHDDREHDRPVEQNLGDLLERLRAALNRRYRDIDRAFGNRPSAGRSGARHQLGQDQRGGDAGDRNASPRRWRRCACVLSARAVMIQRRSCRHAFARHRTVQQGGKKQIGTRIVGCQPALRQAQDQRIELRLPRNRQPRPLGIGERRSETIARLIHRAVAARHRS